MPLPRKRAASTDPASKTKKARPGNRKAEATKDTTEITISSSPDPQALAAGERETNVNASSKARSANDTTNEDLPSSPSPNTGQAAVRKSADSKVQDLLVPATTKTEDWVKRFRDIIDAEEKGLLSKLEERREQLSADTNAFKERLLPIFKQALLAFDTDEVWTRATHTYSTRKVQVEKGTRQQAAQPPRAPSSPNSQRQNSSQESLNSNAVLHVPFTSMAQQHSGDRISDVFDAAGALIGTYEALVEGQKTPKTAGLVQLENDIADEKKAATELIEAGRKVVLRDVQKMLADRYHEVQGRSTLTKEEETKGRAVLDKGADELGERDEISGVSWGEIAYEAQKAVRGLSRVGTDD